MHIKTSEIKGLLFKTLFIVLSAIGITVNKQFLKSLGSCQLFFLSSCAGLLFIAFFTKVIQKKSLRASTKELTAQYFLRGSFNTMGRTLFLFGLITIDTTIATTMSYLRPIFAIVIAIVFLNERLTIKTLIGLLLSVLGAAVVLIPVMGPANAVNVSSIIAIILSQIVMAMHDVIVKMQSRKDNWDKQTYLVFLMISILSCPLAFIDWRPVSLNAIMVIMLMGCIYIVMEMSLANALKRITLVLAAPIDFVRIVSIAILAYIFFDEIITLNTAIGCGLIIFATLVIFTKIPKRKGVEVKVEEA